jgi:hypothetical protein
MLIVFFYFLSKKTAPYGIFLCMVFNEYTVMVRYDIISKLNIGTMFHILRYFPPKKFHENGI